MEERHFNLCGAGIDLLFNSERWAKSLLTYLAIPEGKAGGEAPVRLSFIELGPGEVDRVIPLPSAGEPFMEGVTDLGRPVAYRIFAAGTECWRDFAGFGRVWFDSERGVGVAALFRDSVVDPLYADIMFGHNVLTELLAGRGFFAVHASCVQVGGKGIIFTGQSGSGKSTAAFALMRKGHRLLADDRILLFKREGFCATTLSDTVKVRRQALDDLFPEFPSFAPFNEVDGELFFKAGIVSGGSPLTVSPLHHAMVFERSGEPWTAVERISPSEVVPHLFPVTLNPGEPLQMVRKFNILMEMLRSVTCYRIRFGSDMDRFCEAVEGAAGT